MQFSTFSLSFLPVATVYSFSIHSSPTAVVTSLQSSAANVQEIPSKPIYDPLGLYPKNSLERTNGLIQSMENVETSTKNGPVIDPLNLYFDKSEVDSKAIMSVSLPMIEQPALLDGSLPGDRGFDPLNFSSNESALQWYRTAEIKHARIAMLAAVGWPVSELFDKKLAYLVGMKPLLMLNDRVPSVLNGGLSKVPPLHWAAVLGTTIALEIYGMTREETASKTTKYIPGDLGFDPLNIARFSSDKTRFQLLESELFNGRLAMLAITGFAAQEWWTQNSVINETPLFFKPFNIVMEQILDAGGSISV